MCPNKYYHRSPVSFVEQGGKGLCRAAARERMEWDRARSFPSKIDFSLLIIHLSLMSPHRRDLDCILKSLEGMM